MDEVEIYEGLGVEVSDVYLPNDDGSEMSYGMGIGLLLPTEDENGNEDEPQKIYMTVPAAKALLIDLRDALNYVEEQQQQ